MTDIRKCAQAVIDEWDKSLGLTFLVAQDAELMNSLRQALAEPVEPVEPVALAMRFHEAYERLAPKFGYVTRQETRAFDPVSQNGQLMIAVCAELYTTPPSVDALIDVLAETPFRKTLGDSQWQATFTDQQLDIINNAIRARGQK